MQKYYKFIAERIYPVIKGLLQIWNKGRSKRSILYEDGFNRGANSELQTAVIKGLKPLKNVLQLEKLMTEAKSKSRSNSTNCLGCASS